MHRGFLVLAAILAIAGAVAYMLLQLRSGGEASEEFQVIVDALGRQVKVPLHVERVVAVGPGALRILVYLGAVDRVVGVEDVEKRWGPMGRPYIMAHPELQQLPSIGPGGPGRSPDPEAIAAVKPDVVFVTFMAREDVDVLQNTLGIPVVSLGSPVLSTLQDLKKFYEAFRIAGKVLGLEERAKELIEFIEEVVEDIKQRAPDSQVVLNVYVAGLGFRGKRGITSTWCEFPLFKLLNVTTRLEQLGCRPGHLEVDRETILALNPSKVFIDGNGLALILQDLLRNREFYEQLKAFREDRVYVLLPYNYYATNLELALANAYFIGSVLFPSRFSDVNVTAKADEIIEFMVGVKLFDKLANYYHVFKPLGINELLELARGG